MDKETLSNYGWIVICVLVMVVMIALAGPFGNFVSQAVQSTTKGLFDVNKTALDAAGVPGLTVEDQEFDVPNMNGGAEKVVYYGDLDKDGDIDSDDLTILQKHTLSDSNENKVLITDIDTLRRADLNGDCTVNVADRAYLAKYVNGMIDRFPVEDMPYYYGDVDMDGDIDLDDSDLVQQYCLEYITLTEEQIKRADVTGDGNVSAADSGNIVTYVNNRVAFFAAGR